MYKKIALFSFLCLFFGSSVYAASWNLPWVTIISRSQRWANESRRYSTTSKTQRDAIRKEQKEAQMNQLLETDVSTYLSKQRQEYESTTATEYLIEKTPKEQIVHEYRETSNGNYLKWPEAIHNNKSKIIIHHTAMDYTNILTGGTWSAIQQMQDIYKYHTFTNGRWDIGYNFVIDPFGNVYEWRAGGEWVVGAHVSWNNTPSLGISLMGNYNTNIPTDASLKALVSLTSALARKYKINPNATVTYFKRSSEAPFLKEYTNYAIAWHTDAWVTSCPGTYIYNMLPEIRSQTAENLKKTSLVSLPNISSKPLSVDRGIVLSDWYYSDNLVDTFVLPIRWSWVSSCVSSDTSILIHSCSSVWGKLSITLEKSWMSGIKTLTIHTDSGPKKVSFMLIWSNDFVNIATSLKQDHMKRKSLSSSSASINKIVSKISSSQLSSILRLPIQVLLYELSVSYPKYDVVCDGWCDVVADGVRYLESGAIVEVSDGNVYLNIPSLEQHISPDVLHISSVHWWLVRVVNYTRKSFAWIPWNTFRWTLVWKKDRIKLLGSSSFIEQAVVVNRLSFDDYMKGIAETSDAEHKEKQKLILLLAKMYALFYITGQNPHPSIPSWSSYQSVDHPDIFQKYVWAWWESTSKVSSALLQEIKDYVILYNGYVPILPYFSCSAGFTWSAKEKRWWNDTPYLQSKLDFGACFDFSGHGVGLSGKWSQYLAEKWWTMEQIMKYYYPGVNLTTVAN